RIQARGVQWFRRFTPQPRRAARRKREDDKGSLDERQGDDSWKVPRHPRDNPEPKTGAEALATHMGRCEERGCRAKSSANLRQLLYGPGNPSASTKADKASVKRSVEETMEESRSQ